MGLFDDLGDLFHEITDIKDEVTKELGGLKRDVKESIADIDQGARKKTHDIKQGITKPFSSSAHRPRPNGEKNHRKIDIK